MPTATTAAARRRTSAAPLLIVLTAMLLLMCSNAVQAMYESQAGVNDWIHRQIGDVERAVFPASGSLAVVATRESKVLAALQLKTGEIAWKRPLDENEEIVALESISATSVLSVSTSTGASATTRLRVWDVTKGTLQSSATAPATSIQGDIRVKIVAGGSAVYLAEGASVHAFGLNAPHNLQHLWTRKLEQSTDQFILDLIGGTGSVRVVSAEVSGKDRRALSALLVSDISAGSTSQSQRTDLSTE